MNRALANHYKTQPIINQRGMYRVCAGVPKENEANYQERQTPFSTVWGVLGETSLVTPPTTQRNRKKMKKMKCARKTPQ